MFTNESDLAAWKEDFFKVSFILHAYFYIYCNLQDNFNVDQCLSTYTQNTDLETLRRELKQYGNELHVAMSDILKTETESIVYLAEDLRNLNSKIEYLSSPISQLEEEIRVSYLINASFCMTSSSLFRVCMRPLNLFRKDWKKTEKRSTKIKKS